MTGNSKEIDELMESMFNAWNRGDLHTYTNFYREDADLVNVLGIHRHGRAEILAELEALHQHRFKGTLTLDLGHTTRFLTPEIAIVLVRWEMQGVNLAPEEDPSGRTRRGVFIHVAESTPQGWQLIASQNTEIFALNKAQKEIATLIAQTA